MELIHVAHRQEAYSFFENFPDLVLLEAPFNYVYKCSSFYLLISGEGIPEALGKMSSFLGSTWSEIKLITNLGVAGSLHPKAIPQQIYSVRTCYHEEQFKSFTFDSQGLDLVSSTSRILDEAQAKKISPIAPMVDRELWGVAFAAANFKIPLRSFKLISDRAGETTQCLDIKAQAQNFSEQLYQYWKSHHLLPQAAEPRLSIPLLDQFYFTQSHVHQFEKLCKKISVREMISIEEVIKALPTDQIIDEIPAPKLRTKKLIQYLEDRLNPDWKIFRTQFEQLVFELKKSGVHVAHDKQMENETLDFSFQAKNSDELQAIQNALEHFPWDQWNRLLNGL